MSTATTIDTAEKTNGHLPKTARTMRKYEACGALCEIAEELRKEIESNERMIAKDRAEPDDNSGSMESYYREAIERRQRWLAALEIAGNALTR